MKQDKHRLNGILILITLALLTGLAPRAEAVDKYWNPTSGNGWNTGANWSPSGVPGAGDVAIFDGNTNNADCALDATVNVTGMVLTNGYSGTVTQGTATPITVGASGWSQSTGTFSGSTNTINLGLGSPNTTGPWILSGGTFNAGNQTINVRGIYVNSSWTYSGGTFNAGSSTVSLWADNSTITISGSQTFNNLTMNGVYQTHWANYTVPTGTTLTVTNTLSLLDGGAVNAGFAFVGTGTIAAQGNITASCLRAGNGYFGPVLLLINGTGDQTFTNGGAAMRCIEINKPSGTLSLAGTHRVSGGDWGQPGSWTYTAGTLNAGASTITFIGENGGLTISGSHTLGNVSFVNVGPTHGNTMTIAAGTTLTVAGTLSFNAASGGSSIPINTGTLNAQGDVSFSMGTACGGTATFTFTGAATQQVSYTGTPNYCQFSPITVNKTGGAFTLATDLSLGNAGQKLVWTNGAVNLSSNTLTVAGAVTIYPGATTLGVTVADTNRAGRLTCSNTVSGLANVGLEVSVTAPKEQWPQIPALTYTILSNTNVLAAPFETETWLGAWRGSVAYTNNGGRNVTLSNVRSVAGGSVLMVQ